MPDFGIFRGFNEKLFGDKLYAGQLPTQLGLIGSRDFSSVFEFSIKTDNAGVSTSTQFRMPLTTSTGLNFKVNWGDNSPTETITNHTLAIHTYASAGTYTISVTGFILGWRFNNGGDRLKMLNISKWGSLNISVNNGFLGCVNLTCTATDAPIITTTTLANYFAVCQNFNGAIGNWDLSNVTTTQSMLEGAFLFNQPIGNWILSNVTTMQGMLLNCRKFNQDISNWDTSNVTNMFRMFDDADDFDGDISNWDISKVGNFGLFMINGAGLSTLNYDLLLVGWEATLQSLYPSGAGYPFQFTISINFGSSKYTLGSAAATARQSLIDNFTWAITDSGGI
jgi:surface protein